MEPEKVVGLDDITYAPPNQMTEENAIKSNLTFYTAMIGDKIQEFKEKTAAIKLMKHNERFQKYKTILSHMNDFIISDTIFSELPGINPKITNYSGQSNRIDYIKEFNELIDKYKEHGESVISFCETQFPSLEASTDISKKELTELKSKVNKLKTNLSSLNGMKIVGGKRRSRKTYRKSSRKSKKSKRKSRKH